MALPPYTTLDDLIEYYYTERVKKDNRNMERIKKFYHDDESFESFMSRIIDKDAYRFEKFIESISADTETRFPNPWRVLFVVLDIVQNEGTEIPPFDTLTKSFQSRSLKYHGWTFSWVHGEGTLISIFNNHDELVYRF